MPKLKPCKIGQNGALEDGPPPRELDAIDRLILKSLIEHPGITNVSLAKFMNLSRNAIRIRQNNPQFRLVLAEMTKPSEKILNELMPRALRKLGALLDAEETVYIKQGDEYVPMKRPDLTVQRAAASDLATPVIRKTLKVEVTGEAGTPLIPRTAKELTDDELRAIVARTDAPRKRRRTPAKARRTR